MSCCPFLSTKRQPQEAAPLTLKESAKVPYTEWLEDCEEVFTVLREDFLLTRGDRGASLMLRFTPSKPGQFSASLQLISAAQYAPDGEELNILATVELRGFAEAAALTLKEFCGTQWPSHLPFSFMPELCLLPGLMAAESVATKSGGHPHSAFKAEEVKTAASTGEISAEVLAPVGRKMEDYVRFTEAQLFQAVRCLLPRIMDFGCSLVGHCSGLLISVQRFWHAVYCFARHQISDQKNLYAAPFTCFRLSRSVAAPLSSVLSCSATKGSCPYMCSGVMLQNYREHPPQHHQQQMIFQNYAVHFLFRHRRLLFPQKEAAPFVLQ